MQVLHIHSGNLYGGVETFLLALARFRALAPSMTMSVALTSDGRIAAELRHAGVPVTILGTARISRPLAVRRARRELAALIESQRPDVVVCHQPWPLALFGSVARRRSIALVLWMHMAASRNWLDWLAWRVKPDTIVCNSRFTAATLPESNARVEVVYAPIGTDGPPEGGHDRNGPAEAGHYRNGTAEGGHSPNGPAEAGHYRKSTTNPGSVRLQPDHAVIIQVSRMEPLKGHAVLLDALAKLRGRAGWLCRLVGGAQRPHEADYVAALREQAAVLGIADRVEFLGERSDVGRLLAEADIYCQPNVEPEAFGISLIEALAAGLPVVTSSLGGAREIVDETCGILVAPRDSTSLALHLSALLDDRGRRERLGGGGPARAHALCNPTAQMPRIAGILQQAAARLA